MSAKEVKYIEKIVEIDEKYCRIVRPQFTRLTYRNDLFDFFKRVRNTSRDNQKAYVSFEKNNIINSLVFVVEDTSTKLENLNLSQPPRFENLCKYLVGGDLDDTYIVTI